MLKKLLILPLGLALGMNAVAGTVIERKDVMGQIEKITLDGGKARQENPGAPHLYRLIDLQKEKVYDVDTMAKLILMVPVPGFVPKNTEQAEDSSEFQLLRKGEGPEVAGYPTEHYQVMAGEEVCLDEYVSAKAAEQPLVKDYIQAMRSITAAFRSMTAGMMAQMANQADPCAKAAMTLQNKLADLGAEKLLMREVRHDGMVLYEVQSIQTDAETDAASLTLPEDFKLVGPGMMPMMGQMPPMMQSGMPIPQTQAGFPGQTPMPQNYQGVPQMLPQQPEQTFTPPPSQEFVPPGS